MPPLLSDLRLGIVVPVYNEAENLDALVVALRQLLNDSKAVEADVVLVDDGSADDSPAAFPQLVAADPRFRVVRLARNFGHQAAVSVGLQHVRGNVVAVMDADLQDPPDVSASTGGNLCRCVPATGCTTACCDAWWTSTCR